MAKSPPSDPRRAYELLISSITDYAIYMLDPEGNVATWNAGARRFKGYEADEIIGQHFSRFFTDEDRQRDLPAEILKEAAEQGRYETEATRVRKDGTPFLAHVVVDAIHGEDGELIGFAKITRDISDRKVSERALFESEQRFRLLVEGVSDYAIYMLDPQGKVTNWNSGAQAIKGYRAEEIVGQHFSRFYTDEDRRAGKPEWALETALRNGTFENEAWRMRKDGSLFWANVVIDPIYNEAGEHVGFAKITRDITDKKRAQDELEDARAALAQAQKLQALGELTGGIAHDFNNLMTVIAGSTDLLLRRPDMPEEKRKRYLEAIVETAKRATTLTSHLLTFGRRQPIHPEVIDVNLKLDAVGEILGRTLGSGIRIMLDLSSESLNIEVDPTELETALLNAAFNARDAMPEGGQLTIRTSACRDKGQDFVRIAIADSGTGMPAEVLERAFEPFFTTKEVGKGTGLGLSQIHGFAAQAGGRAEIRSEQAPPGGKGGTTVSLVLPRTDKAPENKDKSEAPAELPTGLRVLLVEDNQQVRAFARRLLQDLKCEVLAAGDGQEALELLDSHSVDVVLSDVVMPRMGGIELAQEIKQRHPSLPVLLATGYSDQIVGGAKSEFAFVRKPYDGACLAAAICAALTEYRERAA